MNSSDASARSRRRPFGVESTGLPADVTSARTCPGPGVSISSASAATGSSPPNSGRPRTRLFQRPGCRALALRAPRTHEVDGRRREHRAALGVEVAGHDVEHVHQPARDAAELLRRDAHASVGHGPFGAREVARDAGWSSAAMPVTAATRSAGNAGHSIAQILDAVA